MLTDTRDMLAHLLQRYPALVQQQSNIEAAFEVLRSCFKNGGGLYVCGNGGSASDAQHIVGELMKSFVRKRRIPEQLIAGLKERYPEDSAYLIRHLQGALPAYSLTDHTSFNTAFINDVCADMVFAQQVTGYMKQGDVLWGITTSGNSQNVVNAFKVAGAMNMETIALTGAGGGRIKDLSCVTISVPETETYKVQELHLPIYHTLCLMLENEFFS
jgi:D-sedoheptulose 7-phosphate isomerase